MNSATDFVVRGWRRIFFALMCCILSIPSFSQSCACPTVSTCAPCGGGLTKLTLKFNGALASTVVVSDQSGPIFNSVVAAGASFDLAGSPPNGKFSGPQLTITVNGVANATISSNCNSPVLIGDTFGSFTVMNGTSFTGGALCCSASVTESIPPVITCPASFSVSITSGCTTTATWSTPNATDNCGISSVTSTHTSGASFPVGFTTVTYTATDNYGNTATCSFTVEGKDASAPVFTSCTGNVEVVAGSTCTAAATWVVPTASDNCSVTSFTSDHVPGEVFPVGRTPVTYTAKDAAGNSETCQFVVVVTSGPTLQWANCPENISTQCDESGQVSVTWDEPTIGVPCGTVTTSKTHQPGDVFEVGDTEVVYSANDNSGRSATCAFIVSVSYEDIDIDVTQLVTPNGDGVHDTWELTNIEKFGDNKVTIVDRWGGVIYKASGYDNDQVVWKGLNTRGSIVPTGTYFYTLEIRSAGRIAEKKGFIELIQ